MPVQCKECQCEWIPCMSESARGGATTGITVLIVALFWCFLGTVYIVCRHIFGKPEFMDYVFAGIFILLGLLRITDIPENRRVLIRNRRNVCPECGAANELRWWN